MAQNILLYNYFIKLTNEQLENILNDDKYTEEAKDIVNEILTKRKEGSLETPTTHQSIADQYLHRIANDVSTIKTIMLIFAIVTGISALITLISLFAH